MNKDFSKKNILEYTYCLNRFLNIDMDQRIELLDQKEKDIGAYDTLAETLEEKFREFFNQNKSIFANISKHESTAKNQNIISNTIQKKAKNENLFEKGSESTRSGTSNAKSITVSNWEDNPLPVQQVTHSTREEHRSNQVMTAQHGQSTNKNVKHSASSNLQNLTENYSQKKSTSALEKNQIQKKEIKKKTKEPESNFVKKEKVQKDEGIDPFASDSEESSSSESKSESDSEESPEPTYSRNRKKKGFKLTNVRVYKNERKRNDYHKEKRHANNYKQRQGRRDNQYNQYTRKKENYDDYSNLTKNDFPELADTQGPSHFFTTKREQSKYTKKVNKSDKQNYIKKDIDLKKKNKNNSSEKEGNKNQKSQDNGNKSKDLEKKSNQKDKIEKKTSKDSKEKTDKVTSKNDYKQSEIYTKKKGNKKKEKTEFKAAKKYKNKEDLEKYNIVDDSKKKDNIFQKEKELKKKKDEKFDISKAKVLNFDEHSKIIENDSMIFSSLKNKKNGMLHLLFVINRLSN